MLWCLTNPPTNPMTMSSGIVGLPLEVARREDAGVVAYRRDFSMGTQLLLAGFPHSSTRTTSWRPTANFVLSVRWQ